MPKFYVKSGNLQEIINTSTPESAAIISLKKYAVNSDFIKTMSKFIIVNEKGFVENDQPNEDDFWWTTKTILKKMEKENKLL
jgi:hypothetical protein